MRAPVSRCSFRRFTTQRGEGDTGGGGGVRVECIFYTATPRRRRRMPGWFAGFWAHSVLLLVLVVCGFVSTVCGERGFMGGVGEGFRVAICARARPNGMHASLWPKNICILTRRASRRCSRAPRGATILAVLRVYNFALA